MVEPDVLADSPTRIGPGAIRALRRRLPGAEVLAAAAVRLDVAGHRVHLVGADPQAFSRFTPAVTARSRALWARVAAGDLAVTFPLGHALHVPLGGEAAVVPAGSGATTPAGAADPQSITGLLAAAAGAAPPTLPVRLGALAAFGLPGVDGVVSPATAHRLGLAPDRLVLVSAPGHDATSVADILRTVLGRAAHVDVLHTEQPASGTAGLTWSGTWRDLYRQAATSCPGLPWQVLAAIGTIESGNGADTSTSSAGAMGPMQFLPSTWASYGVDADHNGRADIMNPVDAVYSAARYLCDNGAAGGGQALAGAVYAYNHADWYVRDVLSLAQRIAAGG